MIVSSFAQQYGIRLLQEDIPQAEYRKLLIGLGSDTPLGLIIGIRSEKDQKRVREMTAHEKKIRREWNEFRSNRPTTAGEQDTNMHNLGDILRGLCGRG